MFDIVLSMVERVSLLGIGFLAGAIVSAWVVWKLLGVETRLLAKALRTDQELINQLNLELRSKETKNEIV